MRSILQLQLKKSLLTLLLLMGFAIGGVSAQQIDVKGRVVDNAGAPVIGATVLVVGTTRGATSDHEGAFSISAESGAQLQVSCLGYETSHMKAQRTLMVTLRDENKMLDDVVVIGYGTVRKKELTGAVAHVGADDITKISTSDLGNAIQGLVAGVSVTNSSGAPGAEANIVIRGYSSISGDNTPLYVVDGVPQEGDPGLSPNEIASIDFLKDAASAAIYGTRGAAGVILITTKSGVKGALKVAFDGNVGVRKITSSDFLMNATEQTYFDLVYKRTISGTADESASLTLNGTPSRFYNDTNLLNDVFLDNALVQDYSISLSGGGGDITYSILGGFYKQDGSIINSGFERFNTRATLNYNKNKFRFGANVNFTYNSTDRSDSRIILESIRYSPLSNPVSAEQDSYASATDTENAVLLASLYSFTTTDNQIRNIISTNFNASYQIIKQLSVNGRVSFGRNNSMRVKFRPYKEVTNSDGELISKEEDSFVEMTSTLNSSFVWEGGLSYNQRFGKHKLAAVGVVTGETYDYEGFFARQEGVVDNDIPNFNGTTINPEVSSLTQYRNTLIGTIGRLQYDWDSRYMLSASVRIDGSSKFAPENRWGVFPSVSGAWNISEEKFFKPLTKVVSHMKLRASYGTTGNQNFSAYSYEAGIVNGYDYVLGSTNTTLGLGSTQVSYANPEIMWETTKQMNIGTDLSLFSNKWTMTFEYYRSDKDNMLFPITLPGSSGSPTKINVNVGNMTNDGFEFATSYQGKKNDWTYRTGLTVGSNSNVVTKINGDGTRYVAYTAGIISGQADRSQVNFIAEGYEAGAYLLYPTNGVIDTAEKLAEYQKLNSTAKMGDLIYVDTNGDGVISDDDRQYYGSGLPKCEIGLNITLTYKNFDIYANLFSALGHQIINGSKATAYAYGRHRDLVAAYNELTNTDSPIPTYRGNIASHDNYRGDTDLWVEDGSYLRMKNLTIGYTLPQKISKKVGLSKARVYMSAQNLFTITGYTGYDPEIGGSITTRGLDLGNYPSFASYMMGVNLTL